MLKFRVAHPAHEGPRSLGAGVRGLPREAEAYFAVRGRVETLTMA